MISEELIKAAISDNRSQRKDYHAEFIRYWIEQANDGFKRYRKDHNLKKTDSAISNLYAGEYMGSHLGLEGFQDVLSILRSKNTGAIFGVSEIKPWESQIEAKLNQIIVLPISRNVITDETFLLEHLVKALNNVTLCTDRYSIDGKRKVEFHINLDSKFKNPFSIEQLKEKLSLDREFTNIKADDNHISFTLIETENGMRERIEDERKKYTSVEEISDSATALINGIASERKEHPYMNSWNAEIWARGSDHMDEVLELLRKEVAKKIDQDEFEFVLEAKKPIWENPTFRLKLTSKS